MEYLQFRGLKWAAVALFACAGMAQVRAQAQTSGASLPPIRIAMVESLSGPFANTGEAVFRNLVWATERVNARGGVSSVSYTHLDVYKRQRLTQQARHNGSVEPWGKSQLQPAAVSKLAQRW